MQINKVLAWNKFDQKYLNAQMRQIKKKKEKAARNI